MNLTSNQLLHLAGYARKKGFRLSLTTSPEEEQGAMFLRYWAVVGPWGQPLPLPSKSEGQSSFAIDQALQRLILSSPPQLLADEKDRALEVLFFLRAIAVRHRIEKREATRLLQCRALTLALVRYLAVVELHKEGVEISFCESRALQVCEHVKQARAEINAEIKIKGIRKGDRINGSDWRQLARELDRAKSFFQTVNVLDGMIAFVSSLHLSARGTRREKILSAVAPAFETKLIAAMGQAPVLFGPSS